MITSRARLAVLSLPFAPLAALAARPLAAWAQDGGENPFVGVPVRGRDADGNIFVGTLDIQEFSASKRKIFATGLLNGTIDYANDDPDADGTVTNRKARFVVRNFEAQGERRDDRAASSEAVCRILSLDLGPLDLDLLGLRVQLSRIELDVTAIPGGGLLGDLLCAVANLLNGGAALDRIARLLNRILRALG